jgi:hypothetical protein
MHKRMQSEFTREAGPASAEASAALATAKALRAGAAEKMRNVAAMAETFRQGGARLAEHPMGKMAAVAGMITRAANLQAIVDDVRSVSNVSRRAAEPLAKDPIEMRHVREAAVVRYCADRHID